MNSQFTTRNGAIYMDMGNENELCVCKSYGPTPETTISTGMKITPYPDILVPYTITEASQGTMLKLFMVEKDFADGDEWFMFGKYAVYLVTSKSIRGWERRWSSVKTFGELFLECFSREQIMNLNPKFAYTLFLRHKENDILGTLTENYIHLCCIYDVENERFVPPTDENYELPEGIRKPTTYKEFEGIPEAGLDEESALVMEGSDEGVAVENDHPLLITFYLEDHLVSVKYITIHDHNVLSIRTLDNNALHSWVLAMWLGMPGVEDYVTQFGITQKENDDYVRALGKFDHALCERYKGHFYKIPFSIYKSGIEDLSNNKEKYTLNDFLCEGVRRLKSSAKNRKFRHQIVKEFFDNFM